jgi:glutamate-1-semialdehyde 2,1-aminomutase
MSQLEKPALKIDGSRRLLNRSDEILIRGCQGHKRNHRMLERGYPVFTSKAKGSRFWDVDGNEYIDYLMGFGPIVLGHGDQELIDVVSGTLENGCIFTTAHEAEVKAAELALEINPWAEMVGFVLGGSAATTSAVRIARAYTGRDVILRCGYHGWHGWTAVHPSGVPQVERDLSIEFPYNDLQRLEDLLKEYDGKVAGVIVETVQHTGPAEGFLQGCIDLARRHGAQIIFDEVKTGFRVALGGATEHYKLEPDMATFGKACCNGLPGSYLVGRRDVLDHAAVKDCWLAATFHCELLSLAAMDMVTRRMRSVDGIEHQWKLGRQLMEGVNAACENGGVAYRLEGLPPMPQPIIEPESEKPRVIQMLIGALRRGHYLHPGHCMFFSLAHTEQDVARTVQAVEEAVAELD